MKAWPILVATLYAAFIVVLVQPAVWTLCRSKAPRMSGELVVWCCVYFALLFVAEAILLGLRVRATERRLEPRGDVRLAIP